MKKFLSAVMTTAGLAVIGTCFAPLASAGCGDIPGKTAASVRPEKPRPNQPFRFVQAAYGDESIVGLWQFTFTAKGNGTAGPPDGTPIDAGYVTWHSDGTELTNSGRDPVTSSFCMGVWKRIGYTEYKLNHWALSWVPASATCTPAAGNGGCFQGAANIQEDITVDQTGNNYTGTFTIDQFDQKGNALAHVAGTVTGKRITAD